jgi:hypothetical protein
MSATSAQPSASAAPGGDAEIGLTWQRVDDPDLASTLPTGEIDGVIAGGPGAIAWGSIYGTGPRIWSTTDGRDWTIAAVESPTDAGSMEGHFGIVRDVAVGGPGFVAVGQYIRLDSTVTAAVWTSTDGIDWTLVPSDPVFERSTMRSVVPFGGQLIAFGVESAGMEGGPPRAWSSADGVTWEIVTFDLPSGVAGVGDPVASADRLWGWPILAQPVDSLDAPAPMPGQTWLGSSDGRTWTSTALPVIGDLYALRAGLYATVEPWPLASVDFTPPPIPEGRLTPGVYRSTNLATWTLLSGSMETVGNDLIEVDHTMIMVGDDRAGRTSCVPMPQAWTWRSVNGGASWDGGPADPSPGTMAAVTGLPDETLLAVGTAPIDMCQSLGTAAWRSPGPQSE